MVTVCKKLQVMRLIWKVNHFFISGKSDNYKHVVGASAIKMNSYVICYISRKSGPKILNFFKNSQTIVTPHVVKVFSHK